MDTNKHLIYYLDSKNYSENEVIKSINETKKEFPNRKISVNVHLNEFGVYVITFEFTKKRILFIQKLKKPEKQAAQRNKQIKERTLEKAKKLEKKSAQRINKIEEKSVPKVKKLEIKSIQEVIAPPVKTSINKVNKIKKTKEEKQKEKIQARFNKYSGNRIYGQYKSAGVFYPY